MREVVGDLLPEPGAAERLLDLGAQLLARGPARVSSRPSMPPPVRRIQLEAEPTVVPPSSPSTTNGGHSAIGLAWT